MFFFNCCPVVGNFCPPPKKKTKCVLLGFVEAMEAFLSVENAEEAGVKQGASSTVTDDDVDKSKIERDERRAKAANPRRVFLGD